MERLEAIKFTTSSDRFLDLTLEAQLLYFNMAMVANKWGQVYNARAIIRSLEIGTHYLDELITNDMIQEGYKPDGQKYPSFYHIPGLDESYGV